MQLSFVLQYATKPRLGVYMEENLSNRIQANEIKPRKHPGVMKIKTVEVPASVISAMKLILKGLFSCTEYNSLCIFL